MALGGDSPAATASVRIGGYSLEVGPGGGSFAHFEPEQESANADELGAALAEARVDEPPAIVAFEGAASEVTSRIEEADELFRAAAGGQFLDSGLITGEIGSLLDLVERLDRSGRFGEQLEVVRSMNRLAVLGLRWLELVRALRSLLGSAEAARHLPGQAWAHHELGSLHLCAGQPGQAEEHLREALRIEDELGDTVGRCATRHNLDSARRDLAPGNPKPRRFARMAGLAVLLPALSAGGALGARPSAETVAVVALLVLASFDPLRELVAGMHRAPALRAVLAHLRPFLVQPAADRAGAPLDGPVRSVRLDAVAARWAGQDGPVFRGVDAQIRPGKWLVVDGPSGAGKTTLLTLLLGDLAPSAGRITVGTQRLDTISREAWRRVVAWCPQDAHVFDSSLRANLLVARPRADRVGDDEMLDVLDRVGLAPLLARLTDGLDARVGAAGASLSGGERQRLAVARALLGRSQVLLLDEPTAHLDEPTARAMMADLRSATRDRCVVLVSHRSTDRRDGDERLELRDLRPCPPRGVQATLVP